MAVLPMVSRCSERIFLRSEYKIILMIKTKKEMIFIDKYVKVMYN